MIKLKKLGAALVFGLILSLVVFTTGVLAQSADQSVAHSKISVSARAAVINNVAQGIAAGAQHAYGWGGQCGWGGECGNFGCGSECGNSGFNGGCGFDCGNNGFGGFFHTATRCSATRICQTIRVCNWSRWGRFCHSVRICRSIRTCQHVRTGFGFGGFDNNWAVKRTLRR